MIFGARLSVGRLAGMLPDEHNDVISGGLCHAVEDEDGRISVGSIRDLLGEVFMESGSATDLSEAEAGFFFEHLHQIDGWLHQALQLTVCLDSFLHFGQTRMTRVTLSSSLRPISLKSWLQKNCWIGRRNFILYSSSGHVGGGGGSIHMS